MKRFMEDLIRRFPELEETASAVTAAAEMICAAFESGCRFYVCGNGGSAADSDHIVGELMKGFMLKRELDGSARQKLERRYGEEGKWLADRLQYGLPAISLTGQPALSTAFANDVAPEMIFAQQIFVMGRPGDVVMGLTTSGNSVNVLNCLKVAAANGVKTIAMTGETGGKCAGLVDCLINVPSRQTFLVQEYHLPIYHTLCMMIEDHFYGGKN